jgi:Flp pilus assembly protein TadD
VDKFEGDAIIAFFGAPNDLENQEQVACNACIDMQKRLSELRIKWKAEGKPELKMRIGLCTGQAVVGNMGSKTRMDYTMMGDTVNTLDHYSRGLNAYRSQNWEEAIDRFKAVIELTPDDGPSKTMLLRCEEYKITPPPKDWDGAFTMKTK